VSRSRGHKGSRSAKAGPRGNAATGPRSSPGKTVPWAALLPALVAAILALPCIRLGYFWDDYLFLAQGTGSDIPSFLLPDPHGTFYRPIPQAAYFLFLRMVDPTTGLLGHILNLAVLAGAITLLVLLVSRLSGPRAGLTSGLIFACLGAVPSLVAWISCSQDLFAIAFVLAAFLLRHERRDFAALACATAAVLCKEPAVAAFPVLALWDRLVGRPATRPWVQVAGYGAVLLLWVAVHPGIRLLVGRGFQSGGGTGYVGLESTERCVTYFVRYMTTLLNLPPYGFSKMPLDDRIPYGLVALLVLIAGVWHLDRRQGIGRTDSPIPVRRVVWIAALFGIPTLLLPALLIRHWAPYFACIPAVAFAMALGPVLARRRTAVRVAALSLFLFVGLRYRSAHAGSESAWTETVFVQAADAVKQVRANFRTLFPTFPSGSQVVISTASTGSRGIHSTLVENQALRVWYGDPTLRAVTTLKRRAGAPAEYLVRITTDLDVLAIDTESHGVRSATSRPPDISEIDRPVRNYARAVAAGGETDRAIRILESIGRAGPPEARIYSERLIASILLAAGRRDDAERILSTSLEISRDDALALVHRLLSEATESERLDEASFEAFGLSAADPEAIRWIMRTFQKDGLTGQAAWYAGRLERLRPGDRQATGVLLQAAKRGVAPSRLPPR